MALIHVWEIRKYGHIFPYLQSKIIVDRNFKVLSYSRTKRPRDRTVDLRACRFISYLCYTFVMGWLRLCSIASPSGTQMMEQPLFEYCQSYGRGKGESSKPCKEPQNFCPRCYESPGRPFLWPQEAHQLFLTSMGKTDDESFD